MGTKSCFVCKTVGFLVGIGALCWGLIAFFSFNPVSHFLGEATTATKIIYGVVGVAGLIKLISLVKPCPCQKKTSA